MERKKLSAEEIEKHLPGVSGWEVQGDQLKKRFSLSNFAESLEFVNKVGELAEAADHHPDITFGWGYAEFAITTHDRGGITDVDFNLAGKIDALSNKL